MVSIFHTPLQRLKYEHLTEASNLELRGEILNQRLMDSHYAQLRVANIDDFRRIKRANQEK